METANALGTSRQCVRTLEQRIRQGLARGTERARGARIAARHRAAHLALLIFAVASLLPRCSLTTPEAAGKLACPSGGCPSGHRCVDGWCVHPSSQAALPAADAGGPDADAGDATVAPTAPDAGPLMSMADGGADGADSGPERAPAHIEGISCRHRDECGALDFDCHLGICSWVIPDTEDCGYDLTPGEACGQSAFCIIGARAPLESDCLLLAPCGPDEACPTSSFGSVCSRRFFPNKAPHCLPGVCEGSRNCPPDWHCVRPHPEAPLGHCSSGQRGSFCVADDQCRAGRCDRILGVCR